MARSPDGEMPFLDHLEELRGRIFRTLGAVIVGFGLGIFAVTRFRLIDLLQGPIAPFLPNGRLTVLSPTEPVMIVLKLGFIVGLVLASPIIIWQIWAFLSPALYAREKKAIVPSLFVGLMLFLAGAVASFIFVVPKAIAVLLSIGAGSFETMITYDKWFGFVLRIMIGMGLSFELPLVIITLAALGVVSPRVLGRFRRYWVVVAFIGGALLSPGPDVFMMMIMTVPLLFLYEVGVAGAVLIHRRRVRKAAEVGVVLLCLLGLGASTGWTQQRRPPQTRADSIQDSLRVAQLVRDSAVARRMGLPSGPSRGFTTPDSIMRMLMERAGFTATRYMADSAIVNAQRRALRLQGNAMTERSGATLEAATIEYRDLVCQFTAAGDPRLFQNGQVVVGDTVRYDTCGERGVVSDALTSFQEGGGNWFIRGNLAVDSVSSRLYAAAKEITSCDLPESHYHFGAKEVKWVSQSVLVARPAVLYIRDVPILWLPFIFQDTKTGRRSGILVPQFGFNDLVRPNRNFNRQVTNVGYYWAVNDYFDVVGRLDWLANRSTTIEVAGQYRWLDRFITGNVSYSRQTSSGGGGTNKRIFWNHQQSFGLSTQLRLSIDVSSNTRVLNENAIDPLLNTRNIRSTLNLNRRFRWGTVTLGGTRSQNPTDNSVQTTFPQFSISPKPIDLSRSVTWSPTLNITNATSRRDLTALIAGTAPGGDSVTRRVTTRNTNLRIATPLRFGQFDWRNDIQVLDQENTTPVTATVRVPDLTTADPNDSITVTRTTVGTFATNLDWETGINLPLLFRRSWKITPSVGIANVLPGQPFMVRNERTGGGFVRQGKRLSLALTAAPTIFGFFGGIGPIERIRHSISPTFSFRHSPKATVSEEFAQAVQQPGQILDRESPARTRAGMGLSQNFEAKERAAPGDSTGQNARKFRLLGISTSTIEFDFEQAKMEGRNGWATQSLTNRLNSDLLPGFDLSLTHNLWRGPVGFDSSSFEPFLENVSASFRLSGRTLRGLGSLLGLGSRDGADRPERPTVPPGLSPNAGSRFQSPITSARQFSNFPSGRDFSASVNVSIRRSRPPVLGDTLTIRPPTQSSVRLTTSFSPTTFWSVAWDTNYNVTEGRFESHLFRLQRDLHDWQAAFNFARNTNGNFSFFFSIHLIDLPDLKFDYNQTSIQR